MTATAVDQHIHISKHAIDRASVRYLSLYVFDRKKDEGLMSWLERYAHEAFPGVPDEVRGTRFTVTASNGMRMTFDDSGDTPVLVTVKP